jgi:hypothetical protein
VSKIEKRGLELDGLRVLVIKERNGRYVVEIDPGDRWDPTVDIEYRNKRIAILNQGELKKIN